LDDGVRLNRQLEDLGKQISLKVRLLLSDCAVVLCHSYNSLCPYALWLQHEQLNLLREAEKALRYAQTANTSQATYSSPQAKKAYQKKVLGLRLLSQFRRLLKDEP